MRIYMDLITADDKIDVLNVVSVGERRFENDTVTTDKERLA